MALPSHDHYGKMKDYKIISRFYRMAEEKIYILLAHGAHIDEQDRNNRNIYSVVKPGEKLLTKLYTPTKYLVLPLLSDICKKGLENKLTTNVKASSCEKTIGYAGLYECRNNYPTRIWAFKP